LNYSRSGYGYVIPVANKEQDQQRMYKVTLKRVRAIIVEVEKQKLLHSLSV